MSLSLPRRRECSRTEDMADISLTGHWVCTSVKWEESSPRVTVPHLSHKHANKKISIYLDFPEFLSKVLEISGYESHIMFWYYFECNYFVFCFISLLLYTESHMYVFYALTPLLSSSINLKGILWLPQDPSQCEIMPSESWNRFTFSLPDVFCFSSSCCWAEPTGQ